MVKADAEHLEFYRATLEPKWRHAVEQIQSETSRSLMQRDILASPFIANLIHLNQLAGDKKAGILQARQWIATSDPTLLLYAVRVLENNDSTDAITTLEQVLQFAGPAADQAQLAITRIKSLRTRQ